MRAADVRPAATPAVTRCRRSVVLGRIRMVHVVNAEIRGFSPILHQLSFGTGRDGARGLADL